MRERIMFFAATLCALTALALTTAAYGQTASISGKVTAADTKKPLAGANIVLQGTTKGAVTDAGGRFAIRNLDAGVYTLTASFVGYARKSIPVSLAEGEPVELEIQLEPSAVPAQTVIVEAAQARERRSPVPFSDLRRPAIEERITVQDIGAALAELPSAQSYSEAGNGIGYTYLTLRGFDQRRISVMINGVPQNDPLDHNVYWLNFSDIQSNLEKIQVQRGAGSGFYGPPAIGGSVNLVTTPFSDTRSAELTAAAGTFNTRRYGASFSSGLLDNTYSVHAKLARILTDGYRERSWADLTSYFLTVARYDEKMTTQINLHGGINSDHLAYYGISKSDLDDRTLRRANPISRPDEVEGFHQLHYNLLNEYRPSDDWNIYNTLFLITSAGYFDYDASWADTSYFRLTSQYGFSPAVNPAGALVRAWVDNKQWGWLPRATYRYGELEWSTGFEFRAHRSLHYGAIRWAAQLPANLPSDYKYYQYRADKDIVSAYTQLYLPLMANVMLMANLQFVRNEYHLYNEEFVGTEFKVPYTFLNPRFGVNYNIDKHLSAFASAAYTSREPRLNNLYDAGESSGGASPQFEINPATGRYDFSKPLVKPEKLLDLEAGAHYADERMRISLTLYSMDFRDEIVRKGGIDRFGQPRTGNAEQTRHRGIETAIRYNVLDELTVEANGTLSSNVIVKHTTYEQNPATGDTLAANRLDGNRLGGFPDEIANARITYSSGGITASLAARYAGGQYTDNFQDPARRTDAYVVADAFVRADLSELVWRGLPEVRLDVFNLFDTLYAPGGIGDEFFPAATRSLLVSVRYAL